jgi:hypothetical protein
MLSFLGMADIEACFRFSRINPDLTGAFGFMAGGYFNLATAWYLVLLPLRLVESHFNDQLRLYPWRTPTTLIW